MTPWVITPSGRHTRTGPKAARGWRILRFEPKPVERVARGPEKVKKGSKQAKMVKMVKLDQPSHAFSQVLPFWPF